MATAPLRVLARHWFLIGIVAAPAAGILLPGAASVVNPGGVTTTVIIVVLFAIIGLTLPAERIKAGGRNIRFHLSAQLLIFVVGPLVFLAASRLFLGYFDGMLAVGFVALGVLPTTVTSCVVFTQAAGGNTVAAVFNAGLANVMGVLLSPALLSLLLGIFPTAGGGGGAAGLSGADILATYRSLGLQMILPILAGQILRLFLRDRIAKAKKALSTTANAGILVIVFLTVSASAADPDFISRPAQLPLPFLALAVIHLGMLALTLVVGRLTRMPREDRIALAFVGPQKTLALGAPLLTTYFAGSPELLGVAILPILFYHPFQLFTAGLLRGTLFSASADAEARGSRGEGRDES